MWNYKTFCWIIILYLLAVLTINILGPARIPVGSLGYILAIWGTPLLHKGITYSIITTLKRFGENWWRVFSLYVLLAEEIIIYTIGIFIVGRDPKIEGYFEFGTMAINIVFCLYVFINTFMVKNKAIAAYFRAYGICLLFGIGSAFVFAMVFVFAHLPARLYGPVESILFVTHTVPLLIMYINLQNNIVLYRVGDNVVAKNDMKEIVAGTPGIVARKHKNMGYYDVEFFDANGNLLNVLTVSSADIAHAETPEPEDLQTRIDNFGAN